MGKYGYFKDQKSMGFVLLMGQLESTPTTAHLILREVDRTRKEIFVLSRNYDEVNLFIFIKIPC